MRPARLPLLLLPLVPLVGCAQDPALDPRAPEPTELRGALGRADLEIVGVSVDERGVRYLFDANAGLFEHGALGWQQILGALPDPGVEIRPPFTDAVAIGDDRFALTAIGDGFLLDVAANTMALHFCYEPGFGEWEEQEQITSAVAYDRAADLIYAQPQTVGTATREVFSSAVASYDRVTGTVRDWFDLPSASFAAGGMTFIDGELYLGSGRDLYRFDRSTGKLGGRQALDQLGVGQIDGLAYDSATNELLIVDNVTDQLFAIDRDLL